MNEEQLREIGRCIISDDAFNGHLETAIEMVKSLAEGEEELTPHLILLHPDPEKEYSVTVVAADVGFDETNKYMVYQQMGHRYATGNKKAVMAFFLMTEAWQSHTPGTEPRLAADRQEVLIVSGMTVDGRTNMAIIQVGRDGRNRFVAGETMTLLYGTDEAAAFSENKLLVSFVRGYAAGMVSTWN